MSAVAESDQILAGAFGAKVGNRIVELHGEPGSTIAKIVVKARIANYERFLPSVDTTTQPQTLSFPAPPEAGDLLALLQFVESTGSFWFSLSRVQWSEVEYSWEAESSEEANQLQISSFSLRREYQAPGQVVLPQILPELLEDRTRLNPLVLPLAFFREGNNDYKSHRYINAFFNFYFFIEDLFGEGHSKNVKVLHAFKRSEELKWAVSKAAEDIRSANMPDHVAALKDFLQREGQSWSTDGFLALLVQSRGNLHHFSQKSTKLKGHPLNQSFFRSLAFLAFAVCLNVIEKRMPRGRASARGAA